jgi:flagellar hook-associated protein 1 FlgK
MLTTSKSIALPGDHSGDTSNLLYMVSLLNNKFGFTTEGIDDPAGIKLYTGTFEEMFKNIGLVAAQDVRSRDVALQANVTVIAGIEDMRNSLSTVSMDEEGVNLLRFQKSYAANARVMTTLDEALDILINRLGIVGR